MGDRDAGVGSGCWRSTGCSTEVRLTISTIMLTASQFSESFAETCSKGLIFWVYRNSAQINKESCQWFVPTVAKKKKKDQSVGWAAPFLLANRWLRGAPPRALPSAALAASGHFCTGARSTAGVTLGRASPLEGVLAPPTTAGAPPVQREKLDLCRVE